VVVEGITPSATLLFRYSALTFNSHRIHYDLPYATEVERYPGLVVQGPLMATLLMQLARQRLGAPLRTFAFRAVRPAHVDQVLDPGAWHDRNGLQLAISDPSGADCMTAQATAPP
jgi:3-methylfumaryl-CoA hydratase